MYSVKQGGFADFFAPAMAVSGSSTKPACAVDIGASSGTHGEWICLKKCTIQKLLFMVSLEAVVGTSTAPYVIFAHRPTPGSDSGKTIIGIVTVPDGTAVGKGVYKDVAPVDILPGQAVLITWVVGTGGSVAGQGNADVLASSSEETMANVSNMIESA